MSWRLQVELDGKPITLLKKGSYFGELSLLRDMRRTASVRVVSETCDLFVLTKAGPAAAAHAATSYVKFWVGTAMQKACVLTVLSSMHDSSLCCCLAAATDRLPCEAVPNCRYACLLAC